MVFKKTIILFLCFSSLASGMHISPTLMGLPNDLKKYLIPHVITATPAVAEQNIFNVAILNNFFLAAVNDPLVMCAILKQYLLLARYTSHTIDLAKKFQKQPNIFPVMKDEKVIKYLQDIKATLIKGEELFVAARSLNELLVDELLADKNIDLQMLRQNQNVSIHERRLQPVLHAINYWVTPLGFGDNPLALQMIQKLLNTGMDPDMQNSEGKTLLMFSVNTTSKNLMKMLLKAGANPDLKDNEGASARDYAWRTRYHAWHSHFPNAHTWYEFTFSKIFNVLTRAAYERKQKLLEQKKR